MWLCLMFCACSFPKECSERRHVLALAPFAKRKSYAANASGVLPRQKTKSGADRRHVLSSSAIGDMPQHARVKRASISKKPLRCTWMEHFQGYLLLFWNVKFRLPTHMCGVACMPPDLYKQSHAVTLHGTRSLSFFCKKTSATMSCVREPVAAPKSHRQKRHACSYNRVYHAQKAAGIFKRVSTHKSPPALHCSLILIIAFLLYSPKKECRTPIMGLRSVLSKTSGSSQYELALFFPPQLELSYHQPYGLRRVAWARNY